MKRFIPIVLCALAICIVSSLSRAETPEVPLMMGYHSFVTDEGGNLIDDGEWNTWFRITDINGAKLYEEQQDVTAIGGRISTLIGNGLTVDGAPTGGVPLEALDPSGVRFLEVDIEGMDPLPAVEMAAVPYCSYSQMALGAAEGSIGYDALAPGTVDLIAGDLTGGAGSESIVLREELTTIYSDPSSANYIGVTATGLDNSTSNDLQNVLDDLDDAITDCEQNISNEAVLRASGDSQCVSRTGDTIDGTITMNGNIVMNDGFTVDGYDVGNEIYDLRNRTSNFIKVLWGSVTGGTSPTIIGPNVGISYEGANKYWVSFTSAMPSTQYAVVLTPIAGPVESANLPRIYDRSTTGFRVEFITTGTQQFDFIVIGY